MTTALFVLAFFFMICVCFFQIVTTKIGRDQTRQIKRLQRELYDIDPVRFAHYKNAEEGSKRE